MNINTAPWLQTIRALLPALLVGIIASPASAAGTVDPDLTVCLKYPNGAVYSFGRPIYLYRWMGIMDGQWQLTRTQYASLNGCTTFADVWPDYDYKGQGYFYNWYNGSWWVFQGESQHFKPSRFIPDANFTVLGTVGYRKWP